MYTPTFIRTIQKRINTKRKRTASVGVDIDALHHYYSIHGLNTLDAGNQAWSVAVPRFLELFKELNIPATFYCVAEDVVHHPENQILIRKIVDAGHEIGNHTWRHPYALTQLNTEEQAIEICEGKRLLEDYSQSVVSGFRAPGYHTHASLQPVLKHSGHTYESSAFPCTPYYLAKSAILSWMKVKGKKSQSIMGTPRVLSAPHQPYWADPQQPYRLCTKDELPNAMPHCPISVVHGIPMIGTAFSALGPLSTQFCRYVLYHLAEDEHLTLEFHAVDLLSLIEDGLNPVLGVQSDLNIHWKRKQDIFRNLFTTLNDGVHWVRLDHYVRDFSSAFLYAN